MSFQKLPRGKYYKLAKPDGFDWYSGKTINYRESIGKKVSVTKEMFKAKPELCSSSVIHASRNPNDCFVGAKIPSSAFIVKGLPVIKDERKCGFKQLFVESEISREDFNDVFGWKILEAENFVHPFKIAPPAIANPQIELLTNWDSVWASVRDSVWASVGDSVWASVRDSVWASYYAYVSTFFPNIKTWKYIKHKKGLYPFQSGADLWRQGLVPAYAQGTWYLLGGSKAEILYTLKREA